MAKGGKGAGKSAMKGKRKAAPGAKPAAGAKKGKKDELLLEDLPSDSDDDLDANGVAGSDVESEEDPLANETADEKRVRMAKQMLQSLDKRKLRQQEESDDDEQEDAISNRLQKDAKKAQGTYFKARAQQMQGAGVAAEGMRALRGHKLSPTCVALSSDDSTAYSGSKDGGLIRWDVETGARLKMPAQRGKSGDSDTGHTDQVLTLALSSDGTLLASGGRDKLLRVWDTRSHTLVESFKGHRDAITSMAFRQGSLDLFTASADRTAKLWNLAEMAYVETLFGHQAPIHAIDTLHDSRAVTVGDDRTLRCWKILDETQLVFHGHTASIDCMKMFTEEVYLSGSQDGSIALWSINKKKPLANFPDCHGPGRWISAVGTAPYSDLAATGSCDGHIRMWRCDDKSRSLKQVAAFPVTGFVNGLAISSSARFVVAAVGQEHRLGRWFRFPEARNSVCIIPVAQKGSQ